MNATASQKSDMQERSYLVIVPGTPDQHGMPV
jgi:hypothetical protein